MRQADCVSHYVSEWNETLIIAALRAFAARGDATAAEYSDATDLADALENDTFLLQTTTPPEIGHRGIDWPRIEG